ncbi:lysophospholipase L1-like esterase [Saccharothrix ecbatanensis]|uniref:Lysophospholipase L1-like esterase n=1 Tax=Saccharothrix ecbatanensis TaxID=1105145 RepID=A0A7W9HGM7_9PSEU|nr:RICIN domain-containing protein [Saccharothrix ecbatanensis]MBB5801860.1 lysophospholipase L1-like esterase [Saccharothrix ecbatanensis]
MRTSPRNRCLAIAAAVFAAMAAVVVPAQATPAPALCAAPQADSGAGAALAPFKVWLAGDSTMANGSSTCPVGWGREFDRLFNDDVTVVNNAMGGRSIQTWLYETNVKSTKDSAGECVVSPRTYASRWATMLSTNGMQSGDWLIIQFGINDGDSNCPRHVGTARYRELLSTMSREAKARGVKPVYVTPVSAIRCSGSTAVATRGFVNETIAQAQVDQVPVIDLHQRSIALYNSLRLCPNNGDYSQGAVGAFFCNDHTHFEAAGAARIAEVVAGALRDQGIGLASSLRSTSSAYSLVAQHSGKAADVSGASTAAGAGLVQWAPNGRPNQQFEFIDTGDGHVRVKARHSGLVLQVSGNSNGADITQQPDTNATSQQWRVVDHGGDVISLVNRQSGLAMDVWAKSTADGARISQYTYNGSANQRFSRLRG